MKFLYFLIYLFFLLNAFNNNYVEELSWQERKQYAKKIINLFINKK